MAESLLRAEAVLRSERAGLTSDPLEFPAPSPEAPPSLAHAPKPNTFRRVRQTWILSGSDMKIPFQEKSIPSRSDLESVAKAANRTSMLKGVKDISLPEKVFHALESSITVSVRGISILQSMLRSFFPMIAHSPEPGTVEACLRDRKEVNDTDLGYLISGILETTESLAQSTLHQRAQLTALYRDRFLESSGFDETDRIVLRSLPLEKDSLFPPAWLKSFLDKRRQRVQEDTMVIFTQPFSGARGGQKRPQPFSTTQSTNKRFKGPHNVKPNTPSQSAGRGRRGKQGGRGRGRHNGSKPPPPKPEPRV